MASSALQPVTSESSGGISAATTASRAGYIPVPLEHVPADAFEGLPVFLRTDHTKQVASAEELFVPYGGTGGEFTEIDRTALIENGIEMIYVRMDDQVRFREQTDRELAHMASDTRAPVSTRATIIYETGLELADELLKAPDVGQFSDRVAEVARAIVTVVLNNPAAFPHLLTASHHDFYTATHLINVATYMVPLAHELGLRGGADLSLVCQAGLLHDIGKLYVPEEVLNKKGKLSDEDWWLLQRHPQMGAEHLAPYAGMDAIIPMVARQHHERLDGGGYPDGLHADEIHQISRICAVVDTFDAMTALRPFKKRALTVSEAIALIKDETPDRLDPEVVEAWIGLVGRVEPAAPLDVPAPEDIDDPSNRREQRRHQFHCPARLLIVQPEHDPASYHSVQVVAHSISQGGLGVLSQSPLQPGTTVQVFLLAQAWSDTIFEAQTVRCREYQDGWYELGMRLISRTGAD